MSSSERSFRLVAPVFVVAAALLLGGCFRPMYATTSVAPGAPPLTETLAAVSVGKIEGRVGQQVRNALEFGLTGGSGAAPPRYRLEMAVISSRTTAIVDVENDEPRIDTVTLTGTFSLFPVDSKTPVLRGTNYARKSFDRGLQRFAALRAARDAENGAARVLADQIKTRVAMFLAERP